MNVCFFNSVLIFFKEYFFVSDELNIQAKELKTILSQIPEVINDRETILEKMSEIALLCRKTLDLVNELLDKVELNEINVIKSVFVKCYYDFYDTIMAYYNNEER